MRQFVKNFNNLIKKTIFKVENKTNTKFKISNFNKFLITFIGLLFLYLFYLLIPVLYEKSWIQKNIEIQILNEFRINISTSSDISYRILPAPHFLIQNSKILLDKSKSNKSIADVKTLKVFLNQKNFFDKEKMSLKKMIIDSANFSLLRKELKLPNDYAKNQFSNKKIKINNSNIFLKDNLNEIITIIKINKAVLFFDDKRQLNLFNLKGDTFGVPFIFNFENNNNTLVDTKINFEAKSLNLSILNELSQEDSTSSMGKIIISILNSTIKTKYNVEEKLITFKTDNTRLKNSKIEYNGKLSINPFDLDLNINLGNYKISQLFNLPPIFKEFIESKLLFNDNLSLDISILADTYAKNELFQNAKIMLNIVNGEINFDNTILTNNNIGLLKLRNSNLFIENNKLILGTDLFLDIKNSENLFSFLNTSKKSRKKIKNILINLDYDFSNSKIKFNKIMIDNKELGDQFLNILDDFQDNNLNNSIKSRRILNKLLDIYEG
ncbi:hypothetical protein ABXT63_01235 [Candidatus Pelagibacter sp. Uisw_092]|uniref:hypothetical protein n=1 Tax=Candidatus Pelagibacter sp. Uisw_092 TaxID=3230979 RepID=UPI0039EB08FF